MKNITNSGFILQNYIPFLTKAIILCIYCVKLNQHFAQMFWFHWDILHKANLKKKKVYFSYCANHSGMIPQRNYREGVPFLLQSWLLWHNTLSFLLRVRLHNLGATRWSPTEKWDCSQMLQASWSVCWSCFGFSSPTQCVPWEVELIMFFNTKVRSKFMEHVSQYKRNQLFGQHYLWLSVWEKVKTQSNYKSLSMSFGYVLLLFLFVFT